MTNLNVQPPCEGTVTLELSWTDAEVLTRAVGMTNAGSLREHAPDLLAVIEDLVETFGRNLDGERNRFEAHIRTNQVYIYDNQNPPF